LRLSGVLRVDLWFRFLLACSVAGAAFSLYLLLGALFHFRGWRAAKDPAIFVVLLTAMAMLLRWSTKPGSPDQSLLVHALYEALAVEPSVTEETSA
jgi:hypothetical protein